MLTVLDAPGLPADGSYTDRKSEFIGEICHVESPQEALAFVETVRGRHPKARHVAYASICGGGADASERMSDDGEPSGTAGKPILDVLRHNDLTDCVLTVTRYFGGVLLGSGGLLRAYSSAASLAVKHAHLARIVVCRRYRVRLDYARHDAFCALLAAVDGRSAGERYAEIVEMTVDVPQERADEFANRVREAFRAAVVSEPIGMAALPTAI